MAAILLSGCGGNARISFRTRLLDSALRLRPGKPDYSSIRVAAVSLYVDEGKAPDERVWAQDPIALSRTKGKSGVHEEPPPPRLDAIDLPVVEMVSRAGLEPATTALKVPSQCNRSLLHARSTRQCWVLATDRYSLHLPALPV